MVLAQLPPTTTTPPPPQASMVMPACNASMVHPSIDECMLIDVLQWTTFIG
jgi:hypothetical protein